MRWRGTGEVIAWYIQGFEAKLWLRKGFGFTGAWTVREQNDLLAYCFGLSVANKA